MTCAGGIEVRAERLALEVACRRDGTGGGGVEPFDKAAEWGTRRRVDKGFSDKVLMLVSAGALGTRSGRSIIPRGDGEIILIDVE
jgi:hypothetical protein